VQARYYQDAANHAAWQYMASGRGNPLIVLPTGAGKSVVIGMLIRQALEFRQRVLCLAHRKELLVQNAEKIAAMAGVQVGLNSAGLRRHDFDSAVICAGIQSVYRKALDFGARGLILIDEAHLISGDAESMYGQFLADLRRVNQRLFAVGLTATPFRTGEGSIVGKDKLFSGICYESMTGTLISEGYLSALTNKPADATVDTSRVSIRGGEFVAAEMERVFSGDSNVLAACGEIVNACAGRRSILVFCAGIAHAEQVQATLQVMTGEAVEVVTGETDTMTRSRILSDFRNGALRWCVNVDVLTTGFDAPRIDALAVLRATMSPGLFAQIVGRGLRKAEGKEDCLVLDFGGNIARHGSLDSPDYGRYTGGKGWTKGEPVEREGAGGTKVCDKCRIECAARSAFCPECGWAFPVNHEGTADTESKITGKPEPELYVVTSVDWHLHEKKRDPDAVPSLCITYNCYRESRGEGNLTGTVVREWVCIEHEGFARQKAVGWWQCRSLQPVPSTVTEAVDMVHRGACRQASRLWVVPEGKWQKIVRVEFDDEIPETMAEPVEVTGLAEVDEDWVPF